MLTSDIFITATVTAIIGLVVGSISTYISFVNKLRTRVAVLEHKVEKVDKRLEKKSTQFDDIQKDLTDIKISLARVVELVGFIKEENKENHHA